MDNGMLAFYKAALQGEITAPLCAEYKNEWRKCGDDKEKLVKLVMRQQSLPYFITHCYQGKGLSKEYIIKNFSDFINGKRPILDADLVKGYSYALYVDFKAICKPADGFNCISISIYTSTKSFNVRDDIFNII